MYVRVRVRVRVWNSVYLRALLCSFKTPFLYLTHGLHPLLLCWRFLSVSRLKTKLFECFKHSRGADHVDGLNTSSAESANAFTQSLKATISKFVSLARATLYTETMMLWFNIDRALYFEKNHEYAFAAAAHNRWLKPVQRAQPLSCWSFPTLWIWHTCYTWEYTVAPRYTRQ